MRAEKLSQRSVRSGPIGLLLRHTWKLGFGLLAVVLLTTRSAAQPILHPVHLNHRSVAATGPAGPTIVTCDALMTGTTTWDANGSPYILPWSDPTIPSTDTTRQPNCLTPDGLHGADVELGPGATLIISGQSGPVEIFSHGAGIRAAGGQIQTQLTDATNFVKFDASPDVASWNGLSFTTGLDLNSQLLRGTGQFDYTSIAHALNALVIDSGAMSLSDGATGPSGFGLIFTNGAIGPSYFDGVKTVNTPVELKGQGDGQFGTVNNIGNQGVEAIFDAAKPNLQTPVKQTLDIEKMVFGSSVPFGQTTCLLGQSCTEGSIGNDAVKLSFTGQPGVLISNNQFFRAGSYGVEVNDADYPTISRNTFTCNGSGSPTPVTSCVAPDQSLLRYPAIYINNSNWPTGPRADLSTQIVGNNGQQNGLDAIAMNGTVTTTTTTDMVWQTPYNDPTPPQSPGPPATGNPPHALGYIVANGDLDVSGPGHVKFYPGTSAYAIAGGIKIENGGLDAGRPTDINNNPDPRPKTITSLRDLAGNFAVNPSFELNGPAGPVGWTAAPQASIDSNAADAHSGNASLQLSATAAGQISSQRLAVTPKRNYTFIGWGRSTNPGGVFTLQDLDGSGNVVSSKDFRFPATGSWTPVSSFFHPEASVVSVAILLGSSAPGTFWFDDVSLTPGPVLNECHTVLDQGCGPLTSNDWSGITLLNSSGNLLNTHVRYAGLGISVSGSTVQVGTTVPDPTAGLAVRDSQIGPTFGDSIATTGVPIYVSNTNFCTADASDNCTEAGPGDRGIDANLASNQSGNLTVKSSHFVGSREEAVLGQLSAGLHTDIEENTVTNAGTYGIHLTGAYNPTLYHNTINSTGIVAPTAIRYPAIALDALANGNLVKLASPSPCPTGPCIGANVGSGNGLDAVAFNGSTLTGVDWQSPMVNQPTVIQPNPPLGYVVTGDTTVNGTLWLHPGDYVLVLKASGSDAGRLSVVNGALNAGTSLPAAPLTLTSLKDTSGPLPCGSVYAPRISQPDGSKVCPSPSAGDWGGLVLDGSQTNTLTNGQLRYADTGIRVYPTLGTPSRLTLTDAAIVETANDAIHSDSPVSMARVQILNTMKTSAGSGVHLAAGIGVALDHVSVDHVGTFGVWLDGSSATASPTLKNVTVTNSGKATLNGHPWPYPAIYLGDVSNADFNNSIIANTGSGNGIDALVFHGSVNALLDWHTPPGSLVYLLDNTLDLQGNDLQVHAGDVVKVGNQGAIELHGGSLVADYVETAAAKVFTSLSDTSIGSCPPMLIPNCGQPKAGDWAGISVDTEVLPGPVTLRSAANLVNSTIRWASNGLSITSGAMSSLDSSSFGVTVSRSTITGTQLDAINSLGTPISVSDSTIDSQDIVSGHPRPGTRGIVFDALTAGSCSTPPGTCVPLQLVGNRIANTAGDGILAQNLAGNPAWIANNAIRGAGTYGMRLLSADELVLRNNNVSSSGNAGGGPYPAVYLANVNADFTSNVRGNVGQGNGINAILMDGTIANNLTWITPRPNGAPLTPSPALGYALDAGLTLDGGDLVVPNPSVVKVLGGAITLKGGHLDATAGGATFTSLRDNTAGAPSCPPSLVVCKAADKGDWGGLVITAKGAALGHADLTNALIDDVTNGIYIDSGPVSVAESGHLDSRLNVTGTSIFNASGDGINAVDTPISVVSSFIGDPQTSVVHPVTSIDGHGIIASFLSPANCPTGGGCVRLDVHGTPASRMKVSWTGKDGIAATGLGGQPVTIKYTDVSHAGTYGIRLVGADDLTLTNNDVTASGEGAPAYPAIYLSGVTGDFASGITGNTGGASNGLNAIVFHGTATTPAPSIPNPNPTFTFLITDTTLLHPMLGYMLDGSLTVNGSFASGSGVVRVLGGAGNVITVNARPTIGTFTATDTIFTSMADGNAGGINPCGSVFTPTCNPPSAGNPPDWGGISVTAPTTTFSGGGIQYAGGAFDVSGGVLTVEPDAQGNRVLLSHLTGDAVHATNLATGSKLSGMTVNDVTGNGINLVNSKADITGDVVTAVHGAGHFAVNSSGAPITIECSTINGNDQGAGGVSFDSGSTLTESDDYNNNGGTDLVGTPLDSAPWVWWGNPNTPGNITGAVTGLGNLLASQSPTLGHAVDPRASLQINGDNPASGDNPSGTRVLAPGHLYVIATFSRRMNTSTSPHVTFQTDTGAQHSLLAGATPWDLTGRIWTSDAQHLLDLNHADSGTNHLEVDPGNSGLTSCIPDPSTNGLVTTINDPTTHSLVSALQDFRFVPYAAAVGLDAPSIYWRLGEANGWVAADSSGNGHTGTYSSSGITYSVAGPLFGDPDTAVTLDGTSGAITESSGNGAPTGPNARSLEAWFNTTTNTTEPVFNYGTSSTTLLTQFSVYIMDTSVLVIDGKDTRTFTATASLANGAWHQLVVTYNDISQTITVYIDGQPVGPGQTTSGALNTTLDPSGLEVGRDNAATPVFFKGSLDEVAIYSTELSSTAVGYHYKAGHGP